MTPWQYIELYGLLLLLIAVHEAGHHLAGALVGYRWKGSIIGPFQVSRETSSGPIRFRLSKKLFSGRAYAFPYESNTVMRQAIFMALLHKSNGITLRHSERRHFVEGI